MQKYFAEGMEALKNMKKIHGYAEAIQLISDGEWEKEIALYAAEYEHYLSDKSGYAYSYDNAYGFVKDEIRTYLRMRPYDHSPRGRRNMRAERWERIGLKAKGKSIETEGVPHCEDNAGNITLYATVRIPFKIDGDEIDRCVSLIRGGSSASKSEAAYILRRAFVESMKDGNGICIPDDEKCTAGFGELAGFTF